MRIGTKGRFSCAPVPIEVSLVLAIVYTFIWASTTAIATILTISLTELPN